MEKMMTENTKEAILKLIKHWEDEADSCEEELENAVSHCRHYYKLLDELKENQNV